MKRHKINWRVPKGAELTELDKKVLFYQDKGHLVPTRQLIKTPEQIEGIRRSGVINTGVLDLVEKEIHAGMSTAEIDKLVYEYTRDHGAIPACLGYEGFPKSCCTSINEVVAMEFRAKRKFWKKATLLMWTVRRFWTVIMPTLHVCSLSEKPLRRKKNWCVWQKNVWKSVWKQPVLSALWEISAMP